MYTVRVERGIALLHPNDHAEIADRTHERDLGIEMERPICAAFAGWHIRILRRARVCFCTVVSPYRQAVAR